MARKSREELTSAIMGIEGISTRTVLTACLNRKDSRLTMGNKAETMKSTKRLPVEGSTEGADSSPDATAEEPDYAVEGPGKQSYEDAQPREELKELDGYVGGAQEEKNRGDGRLHDDYCGRLGEHQMESVGDPLKRVGHKPRGEPHDLERKGKDVSQDK
jgi:hypothetical protein